MEKMPWIVSSQDVDALALQSYSRKEKSLGVLVSKYFYISPSLSIICFHQIWFLMCVRTYVRSSFVRIYNRDDVDLFGIDEAAAKLGEIQKFFEILKAFFFIGWDSIRTIVVWQELNDGVYMM